METLKEDIHQELRRLRLDKKHLYGTLLKIIDAIPQEERPSVATEPEPTPVPVEPEPTPVTVAEVPIVEPEVPTVKKTSGRKKKVTVKV